MDDTMKKPSETDWKNLAEMRCQEDRLLWLTPLPDAFFRRWAWTTL